MTGTRAQPKLALHGGPRTIPRSLRRYNPIGREELEAARAVIESGVLSQYLGAWHEDFYGGPRVRAFEKAWAAFFGVKHAVSLNSLTSGLSAAVGAIGIEPGDEVIVSPWTMSASATAIIHWGGIPVFADIEPETFCLDPAAVEANITPHTRAIMAVDIFGHPANLEPLLAIARRHGLKVITDTAQAPAAQYCGRYAGTLADIGGFSLNFHKHIHTGEGGVMVTNDDALAERMQLIRNHAEAVVGGKGVSDLRNMVGFNYRMGEIEAAIGTEQLKKLPRLVARRQQVAERLTGGLGGLRGLRPPVVLPGCSHVYYVYPIVVDPDQTGVPRGKIVEALKAEGVEYVGGGYTQIHLLPMYQKKIAYGSSGYPWSIARREVDYRKGICPVAEGLHDRTYIGYQVCMPALDSDADVDLVIEAFQKVWSHLDGLR